MNIGAKIITAALCAVALAVGVALWIQKIVIEKQGVAMTIDTMRAATAEAESVREGVSQLSQRGAFDRKKLLEEFRATGDLRNSAIYRTIPVVAAWEAIDRVAKQQGYEFRIPKNQARNPKNNPRPEEREILDALEKQGLPEYIKVDRSANTVIYARPIKLTADCLHCHGDPANSPTHDGKDIVGLPMENWKTGEVHGAFVLKTDFKNIDAVTTSGMLRCVAWLLPLSLGIGLGFYTFNQRVIVRPLRQLADTIGASADQTAAAAGQVSSSSQSLAEGASEQAASLEETSASLEELSSMTKRNAESSQQAKQAATTARGSADTGAHQMEAMQNAMQTIKSASEDITKILKTIDEIAFQTNILALNAAVEAARAGEHGAGFAVVAEEVRALAQRSAVAAKETAAKIEHSVAQSQHGVTISAEVAKSFADIQTRIQQLETLVGEIATASTEQSQGIGQVTTAVSEMDKVTQSNAGNAEETAAAAEELNSQSLMLKEAVGQLQTLTGANSAVAVAGAAPHRSPVRPKPAAATTLRPKPAAGSAAPAHHEADDFFKKT